MENNKQQIQGIDFARVCSAIGIIIVHFFCYSNSTFKFLFVTANASWSFMFVTIFFLISGCVLYYNHDKIKDLKSFYIKRWKSIFPAFYFCWILFSIEKIVLTKEIFWGGNPLKLIFTFLGIDGYFLYKIPNYYLIGEWFLGAIIMLYFLYPFLLYVMNKNQFIVSFLMISCYIFMLRSDFFEISATRNMITCMTSFYLGIILCKYKNIFFDNKIVGLISLCMFICLCFIRFPYFLFLHQIQSLMLFIVFVHLGNFILPSDICVWVGGGTYGMFLLQHMVILHVFYFFNPKELYKVIPLLLVVIFLTILAAKILNIASKSVIKNLFLGSLIQFHQAHHDNLDTEGR